MFSTFSRGAFVALLLTAAGTPPALAQRTDVTASGRPEDLKIVVADPNRIYEVVNEPATPPGGTEGLNTYLLTRLTYPASALTARTEGIDSVEFVVEADGSLTGVGLRGPGIQPDCDAEALRVVRACPAWTPAQHRGNVVRQRMAVAVRFAPPLGPAAATGPAVKGRRNAFTGKSIAAPAAAPAEDHVVTPEKPAEYPDGGMAGFKEWLHDHIQYPEEARADSIQGEVKVEFTVDTDGTLINCKPLTQFGHGLEDEALRLLRVCPDWTAAIYHGGPIRSVFVIAIPFAIE